MGIELRLPPRGGGFGVRTLPGLSCAAGVCSNRGGVVSSVAVLRRCLWSKAEWWVSCRYCIIVQIIAKSLISWQFYITRCRFAPGRLDPPAAHKVAAARDRDINIRIRILLFRFRVLMTTSFHKVATWNEV